MPLPAVLLKAKSALKKAQTAKNIKNSISEGEEATNTIVGANKKIFALTAIIILPFIFVMVFIVLMVGLDEKLLDMHMAVNSAEASEVNPACSGSIADYIAWAKKIADDDTHGYSQDNRTGNPDYDCSSFVYYALKDGAGFSTDTLGDSDFYTGNMSERLKKSGFEKKAFNGKESELQVGDILWVHGGEKHTEIYIGEGKTIGAHSNYDGKTGDGAGDEIAAVKGSWSKYTHYFRLTSDAAGDSTCEGNDKILILAGHLWCEKCADARESSTKSGYVEPEETRKLAKKIQSNLSALGVSADIGNALLAGDNDRMNASFFMATTHLNKCSKTVRENFEKYNWGQYKYVIEVHFNASVEHADKKIGKASGTCLMKYNDDFNYTSKADDDIVKAITKYTGKKNHGWCSSKIKNTKTQSYFYQKNIPMTYVEVEYYDNKKAMDKYTSQSDNIAKGIAEAIKKHYS